ncbi:hypothetical protein [Amycolatopsis sp. NPDC059021]|uniref:hypothetical protein n=1 Tax=Amycolatopsis sp. NPDC059021 TaxID=3346704 RepID=UPI00367001A5
MSTETVAAPQDAQHVPLSEADRLAQDAASAAQVRALANHPDVIALKVERLRGWIDRIVWLAIALGLGFTMVNVQTFAAHGQAPWSLPWVAAWLLDPMVSLVLVAVLLAEQITSRYEVPTAAWSRRTKWFAFAATYVMNTWQSWHELSVSGIVLHSVPPLLVFCAAECSPELRGTLTEAVFEAASPAHASSLAVSATSADQPGEHAPADAGQTGDPAASAPSSTERPAPAPRKRPAGRRTASKAPAKQGRKLLADYLAEARAAWAPGIEITPKWVREVCPSQPSRGTSKNVADALAAEIAAATLPATTPTPVADPVRADSKEAA